MEDHPLHSSPNFKAATLLQRRVFSTPNRHNHFPSKALLKVVNFLIPKPPLALGAQVDENELLVEDWVLDTSESTELPNVEGLSPLSVEPLAFSLPLAMEGQEVLGVENPVKGEAYSEWVQSRFKGFDNFLGTSLKGLENQATTFLLAVEAELHRRAALEKKASDLKSSGVKGIRELKGLFSSINYGSTSTRRSGTNRERALSVPK